MSKKKVKAKKLKKFSFSLVSTKIVPVYFDVEVEAENKQAAFDKAMELASEPAATYHEGEPDYQDDWECSASSETQV